ncbi:ABC-type transporter Mla maintaining outer membrane lipid asymmetry permease subunit MlaE [Pontibacter aydingkolensis]
MPLIKFIIAIACLIGLYFVYKDFYNYNPTLFWISVKLSLLYGLFKAVTEDETK